MLSVVLAVHNEEKNLARCLDSVVGVADEIIVVDGESTDNTLRIARKFKARIISTTNKNNFHINKQMAMDAAKGDLVLQLDADEVADAELLQFISELKDSESSTSAWWIRRKNFFLTRFLSKGGQYPDPVIRLYKNGKAHLPQKNVHEQMTVDGVTETATGHLLHYPYPDFSTYMRKFGTYTSFEASRISDTMRLNYKNTLLYFIGLPIKTFFLMYLRHKGFVDGLPGFVFALMSSLHHPFVYLQVWESKSRS